MFHFVVRGISVIIAASYAFLTIGISYFTAVSEAAAKDMSDPSGEIAIDAKDNRITDISVLQNRGEIGLKLQQAIDLYSNEIPESIQFSVRTVDSESDYRSALRSRLLSGDGPDLFMISGAGESIEFRKYLCDLSFLPWVTKAYPIMLDAVMNGEEVLGVPYSAEGLGLVCNREIFENADIAVHDIQSFEALSEAFGELKEKIESESLGEDYIGLEAVCELAAYDRSFLGSDLLDVALTDAFKTPLEAAEAAKVTFNASDSVEELIKLMASHSASRSNWSGLAEITQARQIERFANGRVAVILGDTETYKRVNEINPDMRGKAFLMPIPLDAFEQPNVYVGAPAYWAVNSESVQAEKDAAGGFLTWLYRSNEGSEFFAENFEAVSAYEDTAKPTGAAMHSQMLGYLRSDGVLPRFSAEVPKSWSHDVFATNVQSYFTQREKTWDDVIRACEEAWD